MTAITPQVQTALALINGIDETYRAVAPVAKHVLFTARTALLAVIKMSILGWMAFFKWVLEKMEENDTMSNEYINKSAEEIRDVTNEVLKAAVKAAPILIDRAGSKTVNVTVEAWKSFSTWIGKGSIALLQGFEKDVTRMVAAAKIG